ncbi:MAG: hypothetical protein JXA11_08275 [Phycisphaerae bacterium]|nr:hypothetical protein [Phycisphaerae bacterium]
MRTTMLILACLTPLIAGAGCVQEQPEVRESNDPDVLTLKRDNVRLRRAREKTEQENITLKDRVASLTERERKLSKKLADQNFELQQLQKQVETLADLPAERDRYQQEAETLKSQVVKLELELRRYRQSSPSDKPATKKSDKK